MSDVEDELLALAGGDVSDDEQDVSDRSRAGSESPLPSSAKETAVKGGTNKKAAVKKGKGRGDYDESEEEGAVSPAPSSPSSQQSVPMEESDSDSDAAPQNNKTYDSDNDAHKYPVEGLFISNAEKAEIMGMREIERETKIAERREEVERIRQNRLLRHMVVSQDTKKRKATAADLEEGQRKTSRLRTKVGGTRVGETSSGIDSLRRAREERSNRMQQRELERDRRRGRSPSYRRSTSRGSRGSSDVEWASPGKGRQTSRTPEPVEEPPAELRDIERIRVGRSRFAEVCFYPGFEESITGCYVRINIGPDPRTGQDVYRMAVIKGFTTGRPYAMPNRKGNQMVVETYVKAAHGKAQREWPFISCSDSSFTDAEWSRYKAVCASEDVTIPKKRSLMHKVDDINHLIHRPWTELELAEKLNRQNSLRLKYSGIERDRLEKALNDARAAGNETKAAQLQDELDRMEIPRLAFKTSLTPTKKKPEQGSGPTQQERLAALNRENRRRNAEAVRQAQLKERARAREIEAKIERGEAVDEDHSRRLKTKAKFLHDVNDANGTPAGSKGPSRASTPATGTSTPAAGSQKQLLPHVAKLQLQQKDAGGKKAGVPTIHRPLMDDDIIGALDLEIDVEID